MDTEKVKSRKRSSLGRGLSALFDDEEDLPAGMEGAEGAAAVSSSRKIVGIDLLEPGTFQPRRVIEPEALADLSASIAVHGVLQPILVREKPGAPGRYEIIAGERRWRASQKAQLHEVPVIVKDFDDSTALEVALIENLQREDLNALEEAQGYRRLMDEFGHTQEKLAAALGKSRSHIANMMRLLNLPESVQAELRQGRLTAGHARALVTAGDPEGLMERILAGGLSVRETERLAAEQASRPQPGGRARPEKDIDTLALESELSNALGLKVSIDMRRKGAGSLRVDFRTLDQLDDVLQRLSRPGRGL